MKKIFGIICGILAISAACFIGACKINDTTSDLLPAPTIAKSDTVYKISFPSIENMKYANIIRLKSSDSSFKNDVESQNIGQVIPDDTKNIASSYMFEDAYTSSSTYYKYQIRYYNGLTYFKTEPNTVALKGLTSTGEAEISGSYKLNLLIDFSSKKFTIQLDTAGSDIPVYAGWNEVDFLLNNTKIIRPFKFGDINEEGNVVAATAEAVDLQKILSTDFLDTPVSFEGIIGMYITSGNADSETSYKAYYWTKKLGVTVICHDNAGDEGYYTDSDGNSIAVTDETYTIPTPKNPDNGFDFSSYVLAAN